MSSFRTHRCIPFALLALLAGAVPASGQAAPPDMVPLEFVRVLAGMPFGPDHGPEVLVGRMPEATARVVPLPPDSRIVGSLVYPFMAVSAVAVPGAPPAVRDEWAERLLDHGWTRYQPPSRGGFGSNPLDGLQFCKGASLNVNLAVSESPRGGSYVHVMRPTGRPYSICDHRNRPGGDMLESPIPALEPPTGSVSKGSASGGGSDHWEAHGRIRTELTVAELVDHYASQLREHGWTPEGRTAGEGVAVEVFRLSDPEGTDWHAVLVVSRPDGEAESFLSLRLDRVERSPY